MSEVKIESPLDPEQRDRLIAIYSAVVDKMKEVVREFTITQDEIHIAGDYLNRLGQSGFCRSLLDVNLAMTSVDATGKADGGTRPNLEGPFHRPHPMRPDGRLIDQSMPDHHPRLALSGRVTLSDRTTPVAGVILDFWQADNEGHYDHEGYNLCGRVTTDQDGRYRIETVVPRDYSDHDHDPIGELFRAMGRHNRRAAHIHLKAVLGDEELLTTQLFFPGSPYLDSDYVEGAVSEDLQVDLRETAASRPDALAYEAEFDVVLPHRTRAA